jgi:hypothetical protein
MRVMAVDHYPEQTLTVHRFARSGDRWQHALPYLRRKPIAFVILDLLRIELVWQSGAYRVATSCPNCGALKLTADDTYAVAFWGGGVDDETGDRDQPQRIECLACSRSVDVTDLLKDWKARDLDALLDGPLLRYAPVPQVFIVAQTEDGKLWIGRTVYDALHGRVGAVYPLVWKLSRIEAMDAGHAAALAEEHRASMPWKDAAITAEFQPVSPGWHGGLLTELEKREIKHGERRAKMEALETLDRDVEQFRAMRAAELKI